MLWLGVWEKIEAPYNFIKKKGLSPLDLIVFSWELTRRLIFDAL
jgi:hypothetical protein